MTTTDSRKNGCATCRIFVFDYALSYICLSANASKRLSRMYDAY